MLAEFCSACGGLSTIEEGQTEHITTIWRISEMNEVVTFVGYDVNYISLVNHSTTRSQQLNRM
jgi:hypothetical protein